MSRLLRRRLLGSATIGAVALSLCSSVPAPAAPSDVSEIFFGGRSPAEFRAKGGKGYSIEVEGSDGRVTLSASGPAGTAVYIVPGRISPAGIVANFGKRGRIDVEFEPSRRMRVETPPNRCEGEPRVTRWGSFVGTIRFAGERGYTRLRLRRVRGRTHVTPNWKCRGRGGGSDESGPGTDIPGESSEDALVLEIANRRSGVEAGGFTFRPPGEDGLTLFIAGVEERRKRMQIARFAFVRGKEASFTFDDSLTTATIAPPPPFSGAATFRRNSGGPPSLTGSLSVLLPGTARIPLVGTGYRSRLYRLSEDGLAIPGV
jgi:hypothetical protein